MCWWSVKPQVWLRSPREWEEKERKGREEGRGGDRRGEAKGSSHQDLGTLASRDQTNERKQRKKTKTFSGIPKSGGERVSEKKEWSNMTNAIAIQNGTTGLAMGRPSWGYREDLTENGRHWQWLQAQSPCEEQELLTLQMFASCILSNRCIWANNNKNNKKQRLHLLTTHHVPATGLYMRVSSTLTHWYNCCSHLCWSPGGNLSLSSEAWVYFLCVIKNT